MSFSEIAQQKFQRFCSGGAVHPRQILQSRSKPKMEEVKGRVSIALLASFFRNPQVVGFRSWAVGRNRRAEVLSVFWKCLNLNENLTGTKHYCMILQNKRNGRLWQVVT